MSVQSWYFARILVKALSYCYAAIWAAQKECISIAASNVYNKSLRVFIYSYFSKFVFIYQLYPGGGR